MEEELDADVVEAIDFCEYYAAQAELMSVPKLTAHVLGEQIFIAIIPGELRR